MIHRLYQFYIGLTGKVTAEDRLLLQEYLNRDEIELLNRLKRHEQVHSINVGKDVIAQCKLMNIDNQALIKAAFLHDIGKIDSGLNLIVKSIIVITNKLSPKLLRRLDFIKPVYTYFNHPYMAEKFLKNKDKKLIYYINNHHTYSINDKALKILQEADSRH